MKKLLILFILFYSCSGNQNEDLKLSVNKPTILDITVRNSDSLYNVILSELIPVKQNDSNRFMRIGKIDIDTIDLINQNLIWNLNIIKEWNSNRKGIKLWFTQKIAETSIARDYGFCFIMMGKKEFISERFRFRIYNKTKRIVVNILPGIKEEYMTIKEFQKWQITSRDE